MRDVAYSVKVFTGFCGRDIIDEPVRHDALLAHRELNLLGNTFEIRLHLVPADSGLEDHLHSDVSVVVLY